jgi:hypothetical protein
MAFHLQIIGYTLLILAAAHLVFPRYFDWKNELQSLQIINREMMIVHTFFVALMVALMGVLCLTATDDLLQTPLGRQICLGFAIFWGCRLIVQFVGYSAENWRGKRFETVVHIVFSLFWAYLTAVFGYAFY